VFCGKQFLAGLRIENHDIGDDYLIGKQTYSQLSKKHNCSTRTIQRRIDKYQLENKVIKAKEVIVLMDTTYWGRNFGVMLFKDALSKENLLKFYVKNESNALLYPKELKS